MPHRVDEAVGNWTSKTTKFGAAAAGEPACERHVLPFRRLEGQGKKPTLEQLASACCDRVYGGLCPVRRSLRMVGRLRIRRREVCDEAASRRAKRGPVGFVGLQGRRPAADLL